jgi:phage tail-like protein
MEDRTASPWKCVPIRRLTLFIESSLYNGTQWVVFVKCDSENNPQSSIGLGVVNILVGFAPSYPAEFVVIQIQQSAGQADSGEANGPGQISVSAQRLDPYKNYKFRLKWDGQYVFGGSELTGLNNSTEEVEHSASGDPSSAHKFPGRSKYEVITLERGLTQDQAFHDWAGLVWRYGSALGSEVSLANFRKNIYLEFYDEAGQLVIAYKLYRCWASEYQAIPHLTADANSVAVEHVTIECEGFERDTCVAEPRNIP